jgi:hypothetical protein
MKRNFNYGEWLLVAALFFCRSNLAQGFDVAQGSISGNGTPADLGVPFGQTFRPTISADLFGIGLGLVNVGQPSALTIELFHTDGQGGLIGSPLRSGSLSAEEVAAFGPQSGSPIFTPVYVSVWFESSYAQSPGEQLAFTINGNPMSFYYGPGNSYPEGQMLGDPSKDLVFSTLLVPEPTPVTLLLSGLAVAGCLGFLRRRHPIQTRG